MGNNVGIWGDWSRPPHQGGSMQSPADSITFDDMTMGDCELDGIIVPCSMATRALGSGAIDLGRSSINYEAASRFSITVQATWKADSGRELPITRHS